MGTLKSVCSSWFALISRDKYEHTHLRVPIIITGPVIITGFPRNICVTKKYLALGNLCLQLNLYETDLLFRHLSLHLTWHCSTICEDLLKFAQI